MIQGMISIGIDAHKSSHVAVAVADGGQVCGQWAGANSTEGWAELLHWAQGLGDERRWGIEGAWNYGRGLAQYLLAAGEPVHEMNTRWTAKERRRARNQSKTDQRDAQAIALYVWREGATLPRVTAEDEAAVRCSRCW
jgi:transposase